MQIGKEIGLKETGLKIGLRKDYCISCISFTHLLKYDFLLHKILGFYLVAALSPSFKDSSGRLFCYMPPLLSKRTA